MFLRIRVTNYRSIRSVAITLTILTCQSLHFKKITSNVCKTFIYKVFQRLSGFQFVTQKLYILNRLLSSEHTWWGCHFMIMGAPPPTPSFCALSNLSSSRFDRIYINSMIIISFLHERNICILYRLAFSPAMWSKCVTGSKEFVSSQKSCIFIYPF